MTLHSVCCVFHTHQRWKLIRFFLVFVLCCSFYFLPFIFVPVLPSLIVSCSPCCVCVVLSLYLCFSLLCRLFVFVTVTFSHMSKKHFVSECTFLAFHFVLSFGLREGILLIQSKCYYGDFRQCVVCDLD